MKKSIHLITSLESGGAQKILYDLLTFSSPKTCVVYSIRKKSFYTEKIKGLGIQVFHLNNPVNILRLIIDICFFQGNIMAWMYHACLLSIVAKINFKRNIYWYIHHGFIDPESDTKSTLYSSKLCCYLSNVVPKKIIYVSKFCEESHIKYGFSKKKSVVIYNYLKVDNHNFDLSNRHAISFIGRNHPNKNLPLFLEAVSLLATKLKINIIGKGMLQEKKQSNFNFIDEQSNIAPYYLDTKIYISTSKVESFGLTVVEALAFGCIVICPNIPIFQEVSGNLPIYYEPDNIDSLVEAINKSLAIKFHSDEYLSLLNKKLKCYSLENTILKLIKIIENENC